MPDREIMQYVVDHNGECSRIPCCVCPINYSHGCKSDKEALGLAQQWLVDHPETPAKPAPDPRRYEIAMAVMSGFAASDTDNNSYFSDDAAKRAVDWADALIAELDKEAAK